jgi:hypothetical protein
VTTAEIIQLATGTLQGVVSSTLFILVLMIGFSVVVGFSKFRPTGRQSLVVKSLDEMVGERVTYLPPDAPRGQVDQLHAAELVQAVARKGG